uniref:Uncharacterized protein n=1 Tax=Zea mays TaxID=4577 RepID=C4IYG6_MAIZE|nr:unknown [Zea mays]
MVTTSDLLRRPLEDSGLESETYGTSLCGSRGNREVFLMLFRAQNSITTLSKPTPKPPCGGTP